MTMVSKRAMSDKLRPCSSRKVKVSATGNGSEIPGGLDQQVVKTALLREPRHFLQQVFAQGAANAAVAHFNEFFFGTVKADVALHFTASMLISLMSLTITATLRLSRLRST